MPSSNKLKTRIIDAAITEAIAAAQWERIDLESRRPGNTADELMLAKSAELAMSPVARDQLLSIALEHGAQHFHPDYPVVNADCEPGEREPITARVLALGPHKVSETDAVVAMFEDRHAGRLSRNVRFDLLADCLEQEAVLQEYFWNHPDIRGSDSVRLTMLCSVPRLRDRAEALSSSARIWRLPVLRWLSFSKRGVP